MVLIGNIKGFKGDKGDKGDVGTQGIQGIPGNNCPEGFSFLEDQYVQNGCGKLGTGTLVQQRTVTCVGGNYVDGAFVNVMCNDQTFVYESSIPLGSVVGWMQDFSGTPSIPFNFALCNGQVLNDPQSPYNGKVLPNLNSQNRFLRGNVISGGEGGQLQHSHFVLGISEAGARIDGGVQQSFLRNPGGPIQTDLRNNEPPYMDTVFIMRIK